MKKVILSAFVAAAALFATSCTKDATETQIAATGDASVAFTVNAPALGSRAYGDGTTANKLAVLVYHKEKDGTYKYNEKLSKFDINIPLQTTVTINKLIKGETYDFLFWASAADATEFVAETATAANDKLFALTLADGNLKVNYTVGKANNENFDAFFGSVLKKTVEAAVSQTVTLKRPFAQVNVGVDDKQAVIDQFGKDCFANATSYLSIEKYDVFNIKTGLVDKDSKNNSTISSAPIPTGTFDVAGNSYDYMLMAYILVPADKEVVSYATIRVKEIEGAAGVTGKKIEVSNVPVQRNYRTNIIGSLFTTNATFNVVIDPIFENDSFDVTDAASFSKVLNLGAGKAVVKKDLDARASILGSTSGTAEPQLILENGATITNPADSGSPQTLYVGSNVNLTISGKGAIKANPNNNAKNKKYTAAIDLQSQTAVVTIDGDNDLIIDGGSGDSEVCACVFVQSGTLNIKGGYFKTGLDSNGKQNPCVLADDNTATKGYGIVNIYGGYFINEASALGSIGVLNVQDGSKGEIHVYGGTFVGQDLTDQTNPDVKNGNIKIATGYHQVKAGQTADGRDIYEVVKD